jgi:hypothetical protein
MTSYSAPRPLNVGNLVSSAFSVYRSNFKRDIKISAKAHAWLLVPVYGWAKSSLLFGIIARLNYQELINQPETEANAKNFLKNRFWSFWLLGLTVGIRCLFLYLGLTIAIALISGIAIAVLGPFAALIAVALALVGLCLLFWVVSRWSIAELSIAIENTTAEKALIRSWELTEKSVFRVQMVLLIAIMVTLPLTVAFSYIPSFIAAFAKDGSTLWLISTIASYVGGFIAGIVVMPFWQIVQALLYYDLCSRKEGVDLKLRSR